MVRLAPDRLTDRLCGAHGSGVVAAVSDLDAMERCIRSAQATDKAICDSIRRQIEEMTTRLSDAGMSLAFARKLAERAAVNALNEMAEENFRGPRR